MVESTFVPKGELFKLLRQIVDRGETGFVTILSDNKRSVLLRFSQGKLTHSHCRSKDVGEAIQVLTECTMVKFSYAPAPVENRPELMPAQAFVELLDPGGENSSASSSGSSAQQIAPSSTQPSQTIADDFVSPLTEILNEGNSGSSGGGQLSAEVKNTIVQIALKYMGPIASMVVDEAAEASNDPHQAINYIASQIPDGNQAVEFRNEASQFFGNY